MASACLIYGIFLFFFRVYVYVNFFRVESIGGFFACYLSKCYSCVAQFSYFEFGFSLVRRMNFSINGAFDGNVFFVCIF